MVAYDFAPSNKGHMKQWGMDVDNKVRTLVVFPKCTLTVYDTRINWRTKKYGNGEKNYDKKAQGAWQSFKNRKKNLVVWDLTRVYAGKWDKTASSYECSCN